MEKPHAISFIGPPVCGKGTQVEFLREHYEMSLGIDAHPISTGELTRRRGDNSNNYVSDNLIKQYLKEELQENNSNIYLLDGVPRTVSQIDIANELFNVRCAVLLGNLDESEIYKRIENRGRPNDNPKKRIDDHIQYTAPLIEHLRIYKPFPLVEIDAKQDRHDIRRGLISRISYLL